MKLCFDDHRRCVNLISKHKTFHNKIENKISFIEYLI